MYYWSKRKLSFLPCPPEPNFHKYIFFPPAVTQTFLPAVRLRLAETSASLTKSSNQNHT